MDFIKIYHKLQGFFYAGDKVKCSICGGKFRLFLSYGVVKRPNAKCPYCRSLERHRLMWFFLNQQTEIFEKHTKLLHVAPEEIFFKKFSEIQTIDYFPCDKFEEGYAHKYPKGTSNIDITKIPFENNTFDAIICNHVLEHIPDDIAAMRELYRVLKFGGFAILQSPMEYDRALTYEDFSLTTHKERLAAFGQNDHVRIYGQDYGQRLEKAGFKVHIDRFNEKFSKEERFRFGLPEREDIYYCQK